MIKKILLGITFFALVATAAPKQKNLSLSYYSSGEPLLYALDYAFGSFGYRFAAAPEILSQPWWGEIVGSISADGLPHLMASLLRPMGLEVSLDEVGVFQIIAQSSEFFELRDTLLVLDTAALAGLSSWCNMPNCTYAHMPAKGSVLLRYRPGFASFVRSAAEAAAPLAVEDIPPVMVHMIIYRHTSDTTRTIGLDYPSTYLPIPDLLHKINLYEESGEIDVTARPSLQVRLGGSYDLFIGSERPYQRSTLQESGAVILDTEYRKYGISLGLDYSAARDGLHSFSVSISSSSYNEDGSNILSETKTEVSLPLDSALLIASVDGETLIQRRRGIPYLCEIPLLGRLFGRVVDVHERSLYQVLFWIDRGNMASPADSQPL